MTTLVLAPILAFTVASATETSGSVTHAAPAARTAARIQGTVNHLVVSELREPQTDAPSPTPAPVIKPLSKPRIAAPSPVKAAPPANLSAAPPANPNSVSGIIEAAAARWGVSGSLMVSIARCESGLRPNAYNPGGPYIGLFQFLQSTFRANGGTNIYDAADQANIAAKMLAHGQAHQWGCA
jgi:soluble lytic murein transglycosylase-like protein